MPVSDPHFPRAVDGAGLASRRAATTRLGEQLRELNHVMVATEVPTEVLDEATRTLRALTETLGAQARGLHETPSVDDLAAGIRMFNAGSGPANPIAPPVVAENVDGHVVGRATLGLAHEGHVTLAHGGVLAVLLDDVLGRTVISHVRTPAMTGGLELRYRRPVPLHAPLVITGEVLGVQGRRVTVRGTICTEAEPDVVLTEADGLFIQLREDQVAAMFGSRSGAGTDVAQASDA